MFFGERRPNDAREAREQRGQCFRLCAIFVLIISTLLIFHLQQERSEEVARQRHRQQSRLAQSSPWQSENFVKLPRTILGMVHLNPMYDAAPAFFETTRQNSLVIQPFMTKFPGHHGSTYGSHIARMPETLSDWAISSRQSPTTLDGASFTTGNPSGEGLQGIEIVALSMDTYIHLRSPLPGCSREALGTQHQCYITLTSLPATMCKPADDEYSSDSLSWTCSGQHGRSGESGSSDENHCIYVISGASVQEISTFARYHYQSHVNGLMEMTSEDPELRAGLILRFCGNPLRNIIAIDSKNHRVFFAQPIDQLKGTDKTGSNPASKRSLSEAAPESKITGTADAKVNSNFPSSGHFQSGNFSFSRSSYCISAVYIDSFYNDVSECSPVPLPEGVGGRVPSYLHFDQQSEVLAAFDYDDNDSLVVSLLNPYPLSLRYSVKLENFRSGWLIASDDASRGKLLLLGDTPPYNGVLEVIDIVTQQHRRVDFLRRPHI